MIQDLSVGEKEKLVELKRLVEDDEQSKNLTIEDQTYLKDLLIQHRELCRSGARPSNHAAAQDARWTIDRIGQEVGK